MRGSGRGDPMEMIIRDGDKSRTYIIKDRITSSTISELERDLMDFYHNDERDVIIDINEVTRIDSLTLAVFLKMKNMLAEKGRKFRLVNLSEPVRKIIEIASLETFLLENGE